MSLDKKPLVLDDAAQIQQLQGSMDLDIPLERRHRELEARFNMLVQILLAQGIQVPNEVMKG